MTADEAAANLQRLDDPHGVRCRAWLAAAAEPPPSAHAAVALADAVRRFARAAVASNASDRPLLEAAAALDALATTLHDDGLPDEDPATAVRYGSHRFLRHPVIGPANGVAPPLIVSVLDDGRVVGTATYSAVYEGVPGLVYGGHLAAGFDGILAMAAGVVGRFGLTRLLEIKYVRPTPVDRPIVYEAWVERADDRSTIVRGTSSSDGVVTVRAMADFTFSQRVWNG